MTSLVTSVTRMSQVGVQINPLASLYCTPFLTIPPPKKLWSPNWPRAKFAWWAGPLDNVGWWYNTSPYSRTTPVRIVRLHACIISSSNSIQWLSPPKLAPGAWCPPLAESGPGIITTKWGEINYLLGYVDSEVAVHAGVNRATSGRINADVIRVDPRAANMRSLLEGDRLERLKAVFEVT